MIHDMASMAVGGHDGARRGGPHGCEPGDGLFMPQHSTPPRGTPGDPGSTKSSTSVFVPRWASLDGLRGAFLRTQPSGDAPSHASTAAAAQPSPRRKSAMSLSAALSGFTPRETLPSPGSNLRPHIVMTALSADEIRCGGGGVPAGAAGSPSVRQVPAHAQHRSVGASAAMAGAQLLGGPLRHAASDGPPMGGAAGCAAVGSPPRRSIKRRSVEAVKAGAQGGGGGLASAVGGQLHAELLLADAAAGGASPSAAGRLRRRAKAILGIGRGGHITHDTTGAPLPRGGAGASTAVEVGGIQPALSLPLSPPIEAPPSFLLTHEQQHHSHSFTSRCGSTQLHQHAQAPPQHPTAAAAVLGSSAGSFGPAGTHLRAAAADGAAAAPVQGGADAWRGRRAEAVRSRLSLSLPTSDGVLFGGGGLGGGGGFGGQFDRGVFDCGAFDGGPDEFRISTVLTGCEELARRSSDKQVMRNRHMRAAAAAAAGAPRDEPPAAGASTSDGCLDDDTTAGAGADQRAASMGGGGNPCTASDPQHFGYRATGRAATADGCQWADGGAACAEDGGPTGALARAAFLRAAAGGGAFSPRGLHLGSFACTMDAAGADAADDDECDECNDDDDPCSASPMNQGLRTHGHDHHSMGMGTGTPPHGHGHHHMGMGVPRALHHTEDDFRTPSRSPHSSMDGEDNGRCGDEAGCGAGEESCGAPRVLMLGGGCRRARGAGDAGRRQRGRAPAGCCAPPGTAERAALGARGAGGWGSWSGAMSDGEASERGGDDDDVAVPVDQLTSVDEFNRHLGFAAAAGNRGRADCLWDELVTKGVCPDKRTLNLMLRCLANSLARPDEAENLAREVCMRGDFSPNAATYNLLAETRFRYEQLCSE
ncbi:hypothetical protein FOA52_003446 [Chlamydomonas sp. UWO 241]|nr:hypothetical protein FOA52_003446 [Chlamydomonas sp. UWO 241]